MPYLSKIPNGPFGMGILGVAWAPSCGAKIPKRQDWVGYLRCG